MIAGWGIGPFTLTAFEDRWVPWAELDAAASPGLRGPRIKVGDHRHALRFALKNPGIYLVASSRSVRAMAGKPRADESVVKYIGESGWLLRRVCQFGTSAGFYGRPANGHSGGWRWSDRGWPASTAYFALYPLPIAVGDAGLGPFWRLCREAQAQAAFAQAHREQLPELNERGANDSLGET